MRKLLELALLVVLPLACGLAVDVVFEWLARHRAGRGKGAAP